MSKFYLPSSTPASTTSPSPLQSPAYLNPSKNLPSGASPVIFSESEDEDDYSSLPYPAPLPRSAFLDPDFSPQSYLSSLRNRHQTLEDLRSDLRTRVQDLSKELFDLVNNEYEAFLSVGSTLRGGDDKIEEVRLGILGFRREIEGVRDKIKDRGEEVRTSLEERKRVRSRIALGRKLLDVEERVSELETRLFGQGDGGDIDEEEDEEYVEDGEDEEEGSVSGLSRLRMHVLLYMQIRQMERHIGGHPFLAALQERVQKVRKTLLLDLGAALRQARQSGNAGNSGLVKLVTLYRELGEGSEAIKILKAG